MKKTPLSSRCCQEHATVRPPLKNNERKRRRCERTRNLRRNIRRRTSPGVVWLNRCIMGRDWTCTALRRALLTHALFILWLLNLEAFTYELGAVRIPGEAFEDGAAERRGGWGGGGWVCGIREKNIRRRR